MIKGIEEAVKDFNEHSSAATIVYDYKENEVWSDLFLTDQEFNTYPPSAPILRIAGKSQIEAEMKKGNISKKRIERIVSNFQKNQDKYDPNMWEMIAWEQEN